MSIVNYLNSQNLARFPFVFIVTYGRSGSTLLQGILNDIPGYCVRGENYATLLSLFEAAKKYKAAHINHGRRKTDSKGAWFGADLLNPKEFSEGLADVFFNTCLRPPRETRSVGFKEIRYTSNHISEDEFFDFMNFIEQIFPGSAFIFNVREARSTARSGWWAKKNTTSVENMLNTTIKRFKKYSLNRHNCFIFSYDMLMEDLSAGEALFDFLGEPFNRSRLKSVLDQPHSYGTSNCDGRHNKNQGSPRDTARDSAPRGATAGNSEDDVAKTQQRGSRKLWARRVLPFGKRTLEFFRF